MIRLAFPNNLKPLFDRGAGMVRGVARSAGRMAGGGIAQAGGMVAKVRNARPAPKTDMTDETLARKVESIVFRPSGAPKSKVDVNVVDGVVHLHGEVKNPAAMTALVGAVEAIPEVKGVRNDLHMPKTKAPSTPGGARRATAKSRSKPRTTSRFNREVQTAQKAEPKPTELASVRAGRQAAPLGSTGEKKTEAGTTPGAKVEEALAAEPKRAGGTKTGTPSKRTGGGAS